MQLRSLFARVTCVVALLLALPMTAETLTVTNANDSGPGSLRHMLLSADAGDRIEFAIGSGPQTIMPLTELPAVSHAIAIDGSTQPGYGGAPLIEIDGSLVGGTVFDVEGLTVNGDVRALAINNFVGEGLRIGHGTVRGCYIGTDRTGTIPKRNSVGIYVTYYSPGSGLVTIGGPGPGDGNVISGNGYGIETATNSTVYIQGNTFGSDPGQNVQVGSTSHHIFMSSGDNKVYIGSGVGNVFVGASIAIESFYEDGKVIENNYIGVTPAGKIIPNYTGVAIYQSTGTYVAGNTIKGNTVGVRVSGNSLRNQIIVNSFSQNNLGIDLDTVGYGSGNPTPNDLFDGDTGPNNVMNFPVLTQAALASGSTTVTGMLSTHPNRSHRIEIYASSTCTDSGYGEGEQIVDVFDLLTDGSGNASYTRTIPGLAQGTVLTATATSDLEGTSEFSPCVSVEGPGTFAFSSSTYTALESLPASLVVRRLNGAVGAASVSYSVTGGTATPGVDFTGASGTLDFANGQTQRTISIPLLNDTMYEGNETIVLQLSNATNGAALGEPNSATITVQDNDPPPNLTIHPLRVNEGNAGTTIAKVRFTLSGPANVPIHVPYVLYGYGATAGVDYVNAPGTVTFQPGETEKFADVTINGDTVYESDETIYIETTGQPWTSAAITIANDDVRPAVTIDELTVTEADVNTKVNLTLRAPSPVTGEVLIRLLPASAQSIRDFQPLNTYITFNHQSVRTIAITIVGDDLPEPDEVVRVEIARWWGDFSVGTNGTLESAITILNDDTGVGPAERNIAVGDTGSFTINTGAARNEPVTIALANDAPDAISIPATLVIPAGATNVSLDVAALIPGRTANVRVTLPASLGGTTHDLRVNTYARATLRFSPSRVTLFEGEAKTITVSADVPHALTVGLNVTGAVEVPASLFIPAGGTAMFTITPQRLGAFTIDAELPAQHGSELQSLFGDVVAKPTTPAIISLTPSHGPIAGGTAVSVSGANLVQGCTLRFGGVPATSSQFVSATKMTAVTPPHAGGSVDVMLICGTDTFTLHNGFGYVSEPPSLQNVQPSTGTTGGGTLVRLTGENLDSSCWVFFGNAAASNVVVRDSETITAAAPFSASQRSVDVSVRCSAGTFALSQAFTYRAGNDDAPFITGVTPAAAAPGERVSVDGLNFRHGQSVVFGTTPATILDVLPDALIVRVPEVRAGRVSIHVADPLERRTTSGPVFSVLEARPPRITSIAPSSVPAGGEVTLDGEGFRPGYTFHIGGQPATIVMLDYTRVVVRVRSDAAPGTAPVEVHNSSGALAVLGPPITVESAGMILTSVDPRCGTTTGGIVATIRGRNLAGDLHVMFDGITASDVSLVDALTLRVRVPAGSAGAAVVTVSDGTHTATLTNGFTYDSPFAPTACAGRTRSVRH